MALGLVGLDSWITLDTNTVGTNLAPVKGGPKAARGRPIYISHFGDIFATLSTKELKFYL
jgi:hypothetical protein